MKKRAKVAEVKQPMAAQMRDLAEQHRKVVKLLITANGWLDRETKNCLRQIYRAAKDGGTTLYYEVDVETSRVAKSDRDFIVAPFAERLRDEGFKVDERCSSVLIEW